MVTGIEASGQAYATSQWTVVGFALGSSVWALIYLGYAISRSLTGPVTEVEARLSQIAAGDFSSASMSSIVTSSVRWRPTSTGRPSNWGVSIISLSSQTSQNHGFLLRRATTCASHCMRNLLPRATAP